MYAIIETGGKQYWVSPGDTVKVDKRTEPAGQEVTLKALWAKSDADGGSAKSSQKASVLAQVVSHLRGPKVLVFKKRTKKAYKKMQGHRQELTSLLVKSIVLG